jgi:alginate O-acetyltransferase complex protein AlgI
MLFNSTAFVIFLIVSFIVYYQKSLIRYQVQVLILASLFFYGWENPWYLFLLCGSAAINILTSYKVLQSESVSIRKRWAIGGVVVNLLILSFFKYSKLFSTTFFNEQSEIGCFLLNIPLAIGISFFTFEGISLVVDVYKQKKAQNFNAMVPRSLAQHAGNVSLFIVFFPHLIAGPILKAHDFIPQIGQKYFKDINWEYCFRCLVLGYFLKMVVADNLKNQTFWISYPYFQVHSSFTLFILLIGYSVQIFADFAGYSLIALGLAGLFGYRLQENFNFPYISRSFAEFWRRWHISLSTFLKEYLYIPLGGNRKGNFRTYFNLMITMFLGGLWHGAAWSYAVWGCFHGAALSIERFFKQYIKLPPSKIISFIQMAVVFSFVTLAWLLFRLPHFADVISYCKALLHNTDKYNDYKIITYTLLYCIPVFVFHGVYLLRNTRIYNIGFRKVDYIWYSALLFLILVNSGSSGTFIYFQF